MTRIPPFSRRSPGTPRGRTAAFLIAAALGSVLAGCGSAGDTTASPTQVASQTTTPRSVSPTSSSTPDPPRPTGSPRPMGHIHGIGRDPVTEDVVLATHGGLFRIDASGPTPVGPVVDLMGFAIAADGSYLASGHPGTATNLPNPVGLIRSTDGGATWTPVSRAGESDFHGLSAGSGLVVGFDGTLRVSSDGTSWATRGIPSTPHVLAASPTGDQLLATTQAGLLSTTDQGRTWSGVDTPELLVAVAWADADTVVGVSVSGRLLLSEDAGTTWTTGPRALGQVTALHAYPSGGSVGVLAVVGGEAVVSTSDLGATTTPLL